jgi:hypothetical protein
MRYCIGYETSLFVFRHYRGKIEIIGFIHFVLPAENAKVKQIEPVPFGSGHAALKPGRCAERLTAI